MPLNHLLPHVRKTLPARVTEDYGFCSQLLSVPSFQITNLCFIDVVHTAAAYTDYVVLMQNANIGTQHCILNFDPQGHICHCFCLQRGVTIFLLDTTKQHAYLSELSCITYETLPDANLFQKPLYSKHMHTPVLK